MATPPDVRGAQHCQRVLVANALPLPQGARVTKLPRRRPLLHPVAPKEQAGTHQRSGRQQFVVDEPVDERPLENVQAQAQTPAALVQPPDHLAESRPPIRVPRFSQL